MNFLTSKPVTAAIFMLTMMAIPASASAQSIFDRLGNQVKQQFEQEIQRAVPSIIPQRGAPPTQDRPRALGSIPGEGGQQNNNGGFDPNGFFRPSPGGNPPSRGNPGRVIPGGGNQSSPYIPPSSSIPSNSYPSNTYPGSTIPSTTAYREPPVSAGDFNGGTIKVRCPKSSSQSVTYKLILGGKSFAYTMRPGESQSFAENKLWLIRYSSGTEEVTYRLRGGNVYSFETSGSRTQLYRDPDNLNEFPEPPTRDDG